MNRHEQASSNLTFKMQPLVGHHEKREGEQINSRSVAAVLLFALFTIALLLTLIVGLVAYAAEVARSNESTYARLTHGTLINTVRAADNTGAIQRGEGPEGPALVLVQPSDAGPIETRLYLFEGALVQEYVMSDMPYSPETAQRMFATDTFDFSLADGILWITTDAGQTCVALRSHEAAKEVVL